MPVCIFCNVRATHKFLTKYGGGVETCDRHCSPNLDHRLCGHPPIVAVDESLATGASIDLVNPAAMIRMYDVADQTYKRVDVASVIARLYGRVVFLEARNTELQALGTRFQEERRTTISLTDGMSEIAALHGEELRAFRDWLRDYRGQ